MALSDETVQFKDNTKNIDERATNDLLSSDVISTGYDGSTFTKRMF
jgi:hypothetical protein